MFLFGWCALCPFQKNLSSAIIIENIINAATVLLPSPINGAQDLHDDLLKVHCSIDNMYIIYDCRCSRLSQQNDLVYGNHVGNYSVTVIYLVYSDTSSDELLYCLLAKEDKHPKFLLQSNRTTGRHRAIFEKFVVRRLHW